MSTETQTVIEKEEITEQTIGSIEAAKHLSDIDSLVESLQHARITNFWHQVKNAPLSVLNEEMESRHRNTSLVERVEMSILTKTKKIRFPE